MSSITKQQSLLKAVSSKGQVPNKKSNDDMVSNQRTTKTHKLIATSSPPLLQPATRSKGSKTIHPPVRVFADNDDEYVDQFSRDDDYDRPSKIISQDENINEDEDYESEADDDHDSEGSMFSVIPSVSRVTPIIDSENSNFPDDVSSHITRMSIDEEFSELKVAAGASNFKHDFLKGLDDSSRILHVYTYYIKSIASVNRDERFDAKYFATLNSLGAQLNKHLITIGLKLQLTDMVSERDLMIHNLSEAVYALESINSRKDYFNYSSERLLGTGTVHEGVWTLPSGALVNMKYFPYYAEVRFKKNIFNSSEYVDEYFATLGQDKQIRMQRFAIFCVSVCFYINIKLNKNLFITGASLIKNNVDGIFQRLVSGVTDPFNRYLMVLNEFARVKQCPNASYLGSQASLAMVMNRVLTDKGMISPNDALVMARNFRANTPLDTMFKESYSGCPYDYVLDEKDSPQLYPSVVTKFEPAAIVHKGLVKKFKAKFADTRIIFFYVGVTMKGSNLQVARAKKFASDNNMDFVCGDKLVDEEHAKHRIDLTVVSSITEFIALHDSVFTGKYAIFAHLDASDDSMSENKNDAEVYVNNMFSACGQNLIAVTTKASAFASYSFFGKADVLVNNEKSVAVARPHNGELVILIRPARGVVTSVPAMATSGDKVAVDWRTRFALANATRGFAGKSRVGKIDLPTFYFSVKSMKAQINASAPIGKAEFSLVSAKFSREDLTDKQRYYICTSGGGIVATRISDNEYSLAIDGMYNHPTVKKYLLTKGANCNAGIWTIYGGVTEILAGAPISPAQVSIEGLDDENDDEDIYGNKKADQAPSSVKDDEDVHGNEKVDRAPSSGKDNKK